MVFVPKKEVVPVYVFVESWVLHETFLYHKYKEAMLELSHSAQVLMIEMYSIINILKNNILLGGLVKQLTVFMILMNIKKVN